MSRSLLLAIESIGSAIVGRRAVPPGSTGFAYHGPVRSLHVVFIGLSVVEIVVVDLITAPWPFVRFPLLALGVLGLFFVVGSLCAHAVRPHLVAPSGLHLRTGLGAEVVVPWTCVQSVSIAPRSHDAPASRTADEVGVLVVPVAQETNIEVALGRGQEAMESCGIPQGTHSVQFWVDDPHAFVAAAGSHL